MLRQDYPLLGRAAHTLKGTLMQCGLSLLAEKAEEIHSLSLTKYQPARKSLLQNLRHEFMGLFGDTQVKKYLDTRQE